jgi:hypothetical protein
MPKSTRLRGHLRANVIGYLALFVALSGTAMALPGKGGVKSNDIAKGAVKGKALAANAVSTPKIRSGAVDGSKLAAGAVSAAKLGAGAVTTAGLFDGSVTQPKLANDSVSREKIVQGTINGGKIANGAIDSAKVENGGLTAEDFGAGQISDGFAESTVGDASGTPLSLQSIPYNAPRSGRLLLTTSATANLNCPPGPDCTTAVALYVDGAIVAESTREISATNGTDDRRELTSSGIASVTQGAHTVQVQAVPLAGSGSIGLENLGTTGILLQ